MPKIKPKLTDTQIKNFKPMDKPYKKTDDGGLTLLIRPSGTKVWQYRYRLNNHENIYTIGQYPEIGAAEARTLRDQVRAMVRKGIDPNQAKKDERIEVEVAHTKAFQFIADDWFDKQAWVPKHMKNIRSQFEKDVYPDLGRFQIDKIKPLDIVAILKKIEARFYSIAYSYNGMTIISYRGTDAPYDVINGWPSGGGAFTPQDKLAFAFYNDVATSLNNNQPIDPSKANISLAGHSLGGGLAGLVGANDNYHAIKSKVA